MLSLLFSVYRSLVCLLPGGRIRAFGHGPDRISRVLVINLNRQPKRWRRVVRELARFRTFEGLPFTTLVTRMSAVDARDGKAVAATADVDASYKLRDQLFVHHQQELLDCFDPEQLIKMTRQEIAVARSHVEAWKEIAAGADKYVLIVEDDIWLKPGAAKAIDHGWQQASDRSIVQDELQMLYLSYLDAGNNAERTDVSDAIFRPVRGLWFLSAYVLSKDCAKQLLRAMPVVGPVDLWMNLRFGEVKVLALAAPVILQRLDGGSDNSYSILPYLARCGIVNAIGKSRPKKETVGFVLASTTDSESEQMSMALSMLGLRTRAYDHNDRPVDSRTLIKVLETYEALVNAPLTPDALVWFVERSGASFIFTEGVLEQKDHPKVFTPRHVLQL